MRRRSVRLLCLLLCLLFCFAWLPACKKEAEGPREDGIRSVCLTEKKKIEVLVTLSEATLQAHKKQKLCLYELLPGEDLSDLSAKEPVAKKRISEMVSFRLPLEKDGKNYLYSSFVAAFSDGTLLSDRACWIENPELIAQRSDPFPWADAHKGLLVEEADEAWNLGVSHAVIPLHLSELFNGSDLLLFNGTQYPYSASYLESMDRQIKEASGTGMQVSVELVLDAIPSALAVTAMLDLLNSRYTDPSGDFGFVSAWMVSPLQYCNVEDAALVTRIAHIALSSRYSNGRVYALYGASTYQGTVDFFTELHGRISEEGAFTWGAAVRPICTNEPWKEDHEGAMTVDKIPSLLQYLWSTRLENRPTYLAVCGLGFSSENEELQAAALAYTYRLSVYHGATMVVYGDQRGADCGLYDDVGNARRIASVFESVDMGLGEEDLGLCNTLAPNAFSKIPETISRKKLAGSFSLGDDAERKKVLFDFSQNDPNGFEAIGGLTEPACSESAAMGHPVLCTWLSAGAASRGEGVRCLLSDGKMLENAFSLSVRMLLQHTQTSASDVTLHLEGAASDGSRVTFETTAKLDTNERWQTVLFYIGGFVSAADLSRPCVLSITVESSAAEGTQYLMWMDSIEMSRADESLNVVAYILVILGGALGGFVITFLSYRLTVRHKRRWAEKHRN